MLVKHEDRERASPTTLPRGRFPSNSKPLRAAPGALPDLQTVSDVRPGLSSSSLSSSTGWTSPNFSNSVEPARCRKKVFTSVSFAKSFALSSSRLGLSTRLSATIGLQDEVRRARNASSTIFALCVSSMVLPKSMLVTFGSSFKELIKTLARTGNG
eukprot:scaffold427_cov108-Isochrysis_galbana.AAC.6